MDVRVIKPLEQLDFILNSKSTASWSKFKSYSTSYFNNS